MKTKGEFDLKKFLDEESAFYNNPGFIENDPVSIPHLFSKKEDVEISGFLAATIAWGQRPVILKNAAKLMQWMDYSPHQFVLQHTPKDTKQFEKFVHRTFNGNDCMYFLSALRHIYKKHGGMENIFSDKFTGVSDPAKAISHFRKIFFELKHESRSEKHVADPQANSSAKRICMFLRWMVRKDSCGVDFGIWKKIKPSQLACPLDLHSARIARAFGLLSRTQNDWKAVMELTNRLKEFDPMDPARYDFALFGIGVNEKKPSM